MELTIEYLPIDQINPYEKNAREHKDVDVRAIVNSIKEFGFDDPIGIWGDKNIIVEGHGRLQAAKQLKLKEVPVIRLDHLTDEQRRAYALAHNKTAELSDWDYDLLDSEISDIFDIDMSMFGFEDAEEPKEVVEDNFEVVLPEEPKAKLGDIYILGDHRLICGDSCSIDQINNLVDGAEVDLVVTDPPYNMNYQGSGNTRDRQSKKILNDHMSDEAFEEFLHDVYTTYFTFMKDGASIYVFYKEMGTGVFMRAMNDAGLTYKQELVWVKNQLVLGGSKYQSMYEPCLLGCKGRIKVWNGGRKQRSVIESIDLMSEEELRDAIKDLLADEDPDVIRERKQLVNDLHPTMKPIRLLAKLIENSSNKGDTVMDLFGGSGSTMIACEQTGRKCLMCELDPKYVDVIIERWETFTGGKAVLLNGGKAEEGIK